MILELRHIGCAGGMSFFPLQSQSEVYLPQPVEYDSC